MFGTFNNSIKDKMQANSNLINTRVKGIQSSIQRSVSRQKNQIISNNTGQSISNGNTEVEKHKKFKDVIERGKDNPVANKVYQYFSKYGEEIAKRAVVVSGLESNWRETASADLGANERSFGPFQINLNAHNKRVSKHSGTEDVNANSKWLQNTDNSLKIAEELYKEQGFKPWTVARKSVNTFQGVLGNKIMDL